MCFYCKIAWDRNFSHHSITFITFNDGVQHENQKRKKWELTFLSMLELGIKRSTLDKNSQYNTNTFKDLII